MEKIVDPLDDNIVDHSPRCATCLMWTKNEAPNVGKCRLNPPRAYAIPIPVRTVQGDGMQMTAITVWPETKAEDFCGDHFDEAEH